MQNKRKGQSKKQMNGKRKKGNGNMEKQGKMGNMSQSMDEEM